jgi:capsular polysaccharide transport system ATP-binding protein
VIVFDQVSKTVRKGRVRKVVLDNVTAAIPTDRHIAVLATSRVERSAFLQLLAQVAVPDHGRIYHDAVVSFPVGQLNGFAPDLSSRMNVAYLARLYGRKVGGTIRRVEKYSAFGSRLDLPFGALSPTQRDLLANVVAFALPFNFYILPRFPALIKKNARLEKLFTRRMLKAGMIVPIREQLALKYCNMVLIVAGGRLFRFDDIAEGYEAFRRVVA